MRYASHRRAARPTRTAAGQAHAVESVTITVTDGDTHVAYWSREAQEFLGYTSAEIIGRPLDDLLSADFAARQLSEAGRERLDLRSVRVAGLAGILLLPRPRWRRR